MKRYNLQPGDQSGWWIITDTKYKITVLFKEHEYSTRKYASIQKDPDAEESELHRLLRATKDLNNYMRASLSEIAY